MLKTNRVTKANDLNLRAYQLTKTEQLLVLSAISLIQPEDSDFKIYKLYIKDFISLLGLEDQSKYVELPKLTRGLMSKVIEIKKPHSLLQVTWFSSAEHKQGEGIIEIEFSPKLKPYLLQLKNNFVTYGLKQVAGLKSKYSIRIYELLKGNEFKKQKYIEFDLIEFREMIGVDDKVYPKYSNFKQKVLLFAQSEIKSLTDIDFNFEEIKTARKVTRLRFEILSNKPKKADEKSMIGLKDDSTPNKLIVDIVDDLKYMLDDSLTTFEILKIHDAGKGNIAKIKKIYSYAKEREVDNIVGYTLSLLSKGFVEPKRNIPGLKKDFEEREYDYDKLERQLLGWDK